MVKKKTKRVPASGQIVTSLALPRQLWAELRALAVQRGVPARQIVVDALERELGRLRTGGK
jgi:predicted DNA-binding ribbon-helix-helix protein